MNSLTFHCLQSIFLLTIFSLKQTECWDLSVLKISPTYYASSITIFKNRAFLALPRSSCFNNITNPTLIEVPWLNDGRYGVFRKKMYPHYRDQRWGYCKDHQDVISVDLEVKKAKLWVLDKGNQKCSAKIVIYNLYYNTIGQSSKLVDVSNEKLNTLVIDTKNSDLGTVAYIGGMDNCILAFSSRTLRTWKIKFSRRETFMSVSTNYLAVSVDEPILYVSGLTNFNLYRLNLTALRNHIELDLFTQDFTFDVNVVTVGEKLGPSSAMATDLRNGLFYYLIRDYAVVRWNTSMPLIAEYHDVMIQNYQMLPYVSHMFHGPKNTIWALVNPSKPETCYQTHKKRSFSCENLPKLKTRIIKVWHQH